MVSKGELIKEMLHFRAEQLTEQQQYKFLTGSVIPRPIAWLSTRSVEGIVNVAPFSFFNVISREEPLYSISILRNKGELKDTARNLLATQEVVLHIVDRDSLEAMNLTSARLSAAQSEAELADLKLTTSQRVSPPSIATTKIRFEGKVKQYIPIKSEANGEVMSDLFIIEVSDFLFDQEVFDEEKEYILAEKLQPIARLAGNDYNQVTSSFELKRPD